MCVPYKALSVVCPQVIQGYGDAPSFDLPPEIMENFRRFDVDGNNVLDPYEFATVLQELHNFTEPYIPLVSR